MCFELAQETDRQDGLLHVSEVLAEIGLPVADTLKDEIYAEVARLARQEDTSLPRESQQRRSA